MNENINEVFSGLFRFDLSQQLRHKADSKSHFPDCGLLVLSRVIKQEIQSGTNEPTFERFYLCRSIQFSGSNAIYQFAEHELMSIDEYNEQKVRDDIFHEEMKNDMRRAEKEILELFGVSKEDYLYLKDKDNIVDTSKKYRVTGWGTGGMKGDKRPHLSLLESILTATHDEDGKNVKRERVDVYSKDEFEIVKNTEV